LAPAQDGVDLAFFNSRLTHTSTSAADLLEVFRRVRPRSTTPTADAVRRVLEPYMLVRRHLSSSSSFSSSSSVQLADPARPARRAQKLEQWQATGKAAGVPRPKPLNLIILTGASSPSHLALPPSELSLTLSPHADGAPDKGQSPEDVLVDVARRLDKGRFPPFQVRAPSPSASPSLAAAELPAPARRSAARSSRSATSAPLSLPLSLRIGANDKS